MPIAADLKLSWLIARILHYRANATAPQSSTAFRNAGAREKGVKPCLGEFLREGVKPCIYAWLQKCKA